MGFSSTLSKFLLSRLRIDRQSSPNQSAGKALEVCVWSSPLPSETLDTSEELKDEKEWIAVFKAGRLLHRIPQNT
jgi:hypothetical protein